MKYQWVIFDADNTVFDFDRSEQQALKRALAQLGIQAPANILAIYHEINRPLWRQLEQGLISADQLKRIRTQRLFESLQHQNKKKRFDGDIQASFLKLYLEKLSSATLLLPGVEETLVSLAPHCQMIILTNGLHAMQKRRLANSPLSTFFKGLISSESFGAAKPHPSIFEHALAEMGNPPREQTLMVGDQLATDIAGANAVGIASCWLNRNLPAEKRILQKIPPTRQPTHLIRHFAELLPIITGINSDVSVNQHARESSLGMELNTDERPAN